MTGALRRPRPRAQPVKVGTVTRRTTQRSCNGCGRRLGDITDREVLAALHGVPAPDVRAECPACTPNPPGLAWTLQLPITTPLSMNARGHWGSGARHIANLRADTRIRAVWARIPPLRALTAELHYAPRHQRVRDPLNLVATLKPVEDGLVDANLVPDDDPRYVTSTMPVIDVPTGERRGRLYVIVRELPPDPDPTPSPTGVEL